MKITDAMGLFGLSGEHTLEEIKTAYKRAMMRYHPDRGGSLEMSQLLTEAYRYIEKRFDELDKTSFNNDANNLNFAEDINAAIRKILDLHLADLEIEVCGMWLWVGGNTKPHKDKIKAIEVGESKTRFFWHSKKRLWYFRPDGWQSANRKNFSMDEIRAKYGSQTVRAEQESDDKPSNLRLVS